MTRTPSASSPTYNHWAGEIQDPGVKRENAIRTLVRRFEEAERKSRTEMTDDLQGAITDLSESARG